MEVLQIGRRLRRDHPGLFLVLWILQSGMAPVKFASATLLCMMCFGILRDWREPGYSETCFNESVKRFEGARARTMVTIPEHPEG